MCCEAQCAEALLQCGAPVAAVPNGSDAPNVVDECCCVNGEYAPWATPSAPQANVCNGASNTCGEPCGWHRCAASFASSLVGLRWLKPAVNPPAAEALRARRSSAAVAVEGPNPCCCRSSLFACSIFRSVLDCVRCSGPGATMRVTAGRLPASPVAQTASAGRARPFIETR